MPSLSTVSPKCGYCSCIEACVCVVYVFLNQNFKESFSCILIRVKTGSHPGKLSQPGAVGWPGEGGCPVGLSLGTTAVSFVTHHRDMLITQHGQHARHYSYCLHASTNSCVFKKTCRKTRHQHHNTVESLSLDFHVTGPRQSQHYHLISWVCW